MLIAILPSFSCKCFKKLSSSDHYNPDVFVKSLESVMVSRKNLQTITDENSQTTTKAEGLYSPSSLQNTLSLIFQIFIYLETTGSTGKTSSDWLNHMV